MAVGPSLKVDQDNPNLKLKEGSEKKKQSFDLVIKAARPSVDSLQWTRRGRRQSEGAGFGATPQPIGAERI